MSPLHHEYLRELPFKKQRRTHILVNMLSSYGHQESRRSDRGNCRSSGCDKTCTATYFSLKAKNRPLRLQRLITSLKLKFSTTLLPSPHGQGQVTPGKPVMEGGGGGGFPFTDFLKLKEKQGWCRVITEVSLRWFLSVTSQSK